MENNIPVTEIMTKNLVTVTRMQKLIDVKHIFEKKNFHHHLPVAENGILKGMISLMDYLYAIKKASLDDYDKIYHHLCAKDIMREQPVIFSSSSTLKDVANELAKGAVHAIIIADEGNLKGIVSIADVIRYFLKN